VARAPHDRLGEPATGELSTLPGREVTVYPGGRIDVRNKMTEEDEKYEKSMGHESRWKRQQRKLAKQQAAGETEETLPKKIKGKRALKGKNFSRGKKFSGKKSSAGQTPSPGKKYSGKKLSEIKSSLCKNSEGKKRKLFITKGKNQGKTSPKP